MFALAAIPIGGAWAVSRVSRNREVAIHRSTVPERDTLSPWTVVASLLLPIVGVVIAIVLLAQGRGSHGAAVLLASMLGAFIGLAFWL